MHKIRAFSWVDEHGTRKLPGVYYLMEGALRLDAAALKRGEVYIRDDFHERARAWYKSEIDRLLRIKLVREAPFIHHALMAMARQHYNPQPRGDYTLAAYDWAQFLNGNQGGHGLSPRAYEQLEGIDASYFAMRLEKAVEAKIQEILAPNTASSPSQREEDLAAALVLAAPEAEMQVSPTLGRWGAHAREVGGGDGGETGLLVEDLGANVVEVSGLRFAVDLCHCVPVVGEEEGARWAEGARVLML
ncbi:hypothetical protein C8A05DRAFT_30076 [Staphylotrichum tortipilum]|uniref:Uncharacterized protein n=1 Tax=Staphylotrichum tortipilum TaxID=2831512 RepID=A0AAN6MT46_9PEZI|nr:hypothetical protein C8A05DRAFT_30076 [Staphylotrichum longicolle]